MITIDYQKLNKELDKYLSELDKLTKDLSEEMKELSLDKFQDNDWPNKKDGTKATLYKSGNLKRGIKNTHSKKSAEIYNKVSYAKYHQLGTDKLPQRKFLEDNEKVIVDLVENLINKIFK